MLAFFYSIFLALQTGSWNMLQIKYVNGILRNLGNKLVDIVVNALGGHFQTIQTYAIFDSDLAPTDAIAAILAVVAMVAVCLAVFKLTKMVFSIFFGGK